ncbi:MAG: hypothetical protein IT378_16990, partial [Sandaracinaceae bacterium]|nr:hypothetical protein [Sandaracinaceae bacterium]
MGEAGFGEPAHLTHPELAFGPRESASLDLFFADLTGDGLTDVARISNGRAIYWPSLGHGRFDEPAVMEGAPVFDAGFDTARLRLIDLDGTGTADLVYAGKGELRTWIHGGGRAWIEGERRAIPFIPDLAQLSVLELDGAPCLVWAPPGEAPQCLRLREPIPRALVAIDDARGATSEVRYAWAGAGERSGLPSQPVVVDRVERRDHVGGARVAEALAYREGRHDPIERRFAGFSIVDRRWLDHQSVDRDERVLARERTFTHDGTARPSGALAGQYYAAQAILPWPLADDGAELALAGAVLRVERYGEDATALRSEAATDRAQVQHGGAIAIATERLAIDVGDEPRVEHTLALAWDRFGQVLQGVAIGYGRRGASEPRQARTIATASVSTVANLDTQDSFRVGAPVEARTLELRALGAPDGVLFAWEHVRAALARALEALAGAPELEDAGEVVFLRWGRVRYWDEARAGPLPLGAVALPLRVHHESQLAFSTAWLARALGVDPAPGGYRLEDGAWWADGPVQEHATRFHQPSASVRPDGAHRVEYDPHALLPIAQIDAAGDTVRIEHDYRALAPRKVTDPNGAVEEVRHDALGVPIARARHGRLEGRVHGHTGLPGPRPLEAALADPSAALGGASESVCYDVAPPRALTVTATGFDDPAPSVVLAHQDGFGEPLELKERVEGGRWRASPRALRDGRLRAIATFEPWLSDTPALGRRAVGLATERTFDALDRAVEERLPHGTRARARFGPWQRVLEDPIDTV